MPEDMSDKRIALFDGEESTARFWRRLRTSAKKSEIMAELISLRWLEVDGKLPSQDVTYFRNLIKAVSAEFRFVDSRVRAQKVMGERREVAKKAHDRRKILIGAFVEKTLNEAYKTGKPEFLRPWLTKGLDGYLDRPDDRRLFDDLLADPK